MAGTTAFDELLLRARGGEQAAAAELAQRYEGEIRVMARVLLGPALRPYLDSMDLVQSVHRSLLVGLRDGRFSLNGPDRLIALALTMIRRKVARQWRRHRRQRRADGNTEGLALLLGHLCTAEDDPGRAAAVKDAIQRVCDQLDDLDRQVMELRLEGHNTVEVAQRLGLDADVLRVRLSRLRQRLRADGILDEWL